MGQMMQVSRKRPYPAYNGFNHVDPSPRIEQLVLILTDFLIPGVGLAADNCMTKILSALSKIPGKAAKFVAKHCERIQCPNCYQWWISQRAFKLAVLVECYALYTKERPAGVMCSIHPDAVKSWTWKDYGNFIRKCYTRMYKLGISGGVRFFHPFRVKKEIQDDLRVLGAKDSGGFWKMIRENVLNLPSWYSYVCLAPHIHDIVFPSFIWPNTASDIVIKKYAVFDTVRDTVAHIRYLLSHCGILTDGENEPASPFGCLHGWKAEEHLSYEQILVIKNQVAEAMGLKYDSVKDDIVPVDVVDDSDDWIPINEFADYSLEQTSFIDAYVTSIQDGNIRLYVDGLIHLHNERRCDMNLEKHERHVFLKDLGDIPTGFKIVVADDIRLLEGIESVEVI